MEKLNSLIKENRFVIVFLLIIVLSFLIGLFLLIFRSMLLSAEYPNLKFEDSISGRVEKVITDGRAANRIMFTNGKKTTLPWATNYNYKDGIDLHRRIIIGDSLLKNANSDTIFLIHDNIKLIFISKKTIGTPTFQ